VYEGFHIPFACKKSFIAGKDITTNLKNLIEDEVLKQQNNKKFLSGVFNKEVKPQTNQPKTLEFYRAIKEQGCFVSINPAIDH